MSSHYLIRLVDEQGIFLAEMQDSVGLVDAVLIAHAENCHGLARYIDPYGKTSFNGMQCEALIVEFEVIEKDSLTFGQDAVLSQLIEMLRRAATEVHLHLVLFGD